MKLALCLLALAVSLPVAALPHSRNERAAFQRMHPCPANGLRRGTCPGYVVDHVQALCAGGVDKTSNMQWQTVAAAKAKDRWECRAVK